MSKTEKVIYTIFFVLISIWCLSALAVPALMALGQKGLAMGFWKISGLGCHQKAERSFYIFGWQMGLCIRCTAIYFSMWLTTILYPLIRKRYPNLSLWIMILLVAPMVLDILTEKYIGFRSSLNLTKFVTGVVFGASLPYYLISGGSSSAEYIKEIYIKLRKGSIYEETTQNIRV